MEIKSCYYLGMCTEEYEENHMSNYSHPPPCKYGKTCYNNKFDHISKYSHPKTPCQKGLGCKLPSSYSEKLKHLKIYSHKFLPPCKYDKCNEFDQYSHRNKFSHRCRYGLNCRELPNLTAAHCKKFFHAQPAERVVLDAEEPGDSSENDSAESESNAFDRKSQITFSTQTSFFERKDQHLISEISYVLERNKDTAKPILLAENMNKNIYFERNCYNLRNDAEQFIKRNKINLAKLKESKNEILDMFYPMHRCNIEKFKLIIQCGMFLSYKKQGESNMPEKFFSETRVLKIVEENNIRVNFSAYKWFKVQSEIFKNKNNNSSKSEQDSLLRSKQKLEKLIPNINLLENMASDFIKYSISTPLMGISHFKDKELETDNHVFTIMGYNKEITYGDIIIVFERDIMYHPDFNMTIVSMGKLFKNPSFWNSYCPWIDRKGADELHSVLNTKLHPCLENWEDLILDLVALKAYSFLQMKPGATVELKHIQEFEKACNSHGLIEGHLPGIIPLNQIKCISISRKVYNDKLSEREKHLLHEYVAARKLVFYDNNNDETCPRELAQYIAFNKTPLKYGLKFTLSNKFGEPVDYPISLAKNNNFSLQFLANGFDIAVRFIDSKDQKYPNGFDFIINYKNSYNKITYQGKTILTNQVRRHPDNLLQWSENNHFKNHNQFCKYQIAANKGSSNSWQVKLMNLDSLGNRTELINYTISLKEVNIQHISFSCWSGLVAFEDVLLSFI